ncbi:MAG TPA: hypothetical protein PLM56_00475 [Cyclobacteriaceae bacterium]|jgi:hypothetical protein|nr:hypothetical protein [Cytophagales bacterium]HRE66524.1 hypothetical protein [Cyclobacteriaceae bacterium]HRF31942.1 hypothetical protein [Cyclobacteriaceae bacterium]
MKRIVFSLLVIIVGTTAYAQTDGWVAFAKTKFDAKYNERAGEYFLFPTFSADLKAQVGKDIELEGYYLPIDVDGNAYIILSKFPYSQCFFCGGAGPESIAEVYFKAKTPVFEPDQFIRIKGKLKLNDSDLEHGNFLIEEAVLIK